MKKAFLLPVMENNELVLKDKNDVLYSLKKCDALHRIRHALKHGKCIRVTMKNDQLFYGASDIKKYTGIVDSDFTELLDTAITSTTKSESVDSNIKNNITKVKPVSTEIQSVIDTIKGSLKLKPKMLIMDDIKWKYLVQSILLGKNIMMLGDTGSGKTFAAQSAASIFPNRPFIYFNMGGTQDPKSFLLGNTHFNQQEGTHFVESEFIKAIQTPNAIILLDEISRIHVEGSNILLSLLDPLQKYILIDDKKSKRRINVADGVSFIATANIGIKFTGTRLLDAAFKDRFGAVIEMEYLKKAEEAKLLKLKFPNIDKKLIDTVTEIAEQIRNNANGGDATLSVSISTRKVEAMLNIIQYGFTLNEAAEVMIYPMFSTDGGVDSERTFVKQIVQKYNKYDDLKDDPFNGDDKKKANTDMRDVKPL